jgi:hypothetical protein
MAFSTTVAHPSTPPVTEKPANSDVLSSLLGALMLSVYAAQKSKKAMRKMRRHLVWSAFKMKMKSMFSKKGHVNNQVLIYILIGIVALILVFYAPILALVIALVALILILAGVI